MIGRSADCGITIDDAHLSQHHCEQRDSHSVCRIVDLGSTDGVFVNDVRVQERELADNDVVRVGAHSFHFKRIH